MVANNARYTALMTLRRSLPNNLATNIVKKSSANHRYNEKIKNTRRQRHVGHLPNNLTRHINTLAGNPHTGLTKQLNRARTARNYKGYHLALTARNNQRNKASLRNKRAVRSGRLTPEQSFLRLMNRLRMGPIYERFY